MSCQASRTRRWGDVCPQSRDVAQSWAWGGESGFPVAVVPTEQPWSLVLLTFFYLSVQTKVVLSSEFWRAPVPTMPGCRAAAIPF